MRKLKKDKTTISQFQDVIREEVISEVKKVKYIGCTENQIKWGCNDDPHSFLTIGGIYTMLKEEVHSWHTKIILKEFPDKKFNSVCFEEIL